MKKLVIAHLYPEDMSIYGDVGNTTSLLKRLQWRGYTAEVRSVRVGENFDFSTADIVFGGGGQDSGQMAVGDDLLARGDELRAAAVDGVPMLLVCGLYQLFGRGFLTHDGRRIEGIGVFDAETVASSSRLIGNVIVESAQFGRLVGFENHSGQTALGAGQEALGRVVKGSGNNEDSGYEGAIINNVIGTYLHGPVLPKNPAVADFLIATALKRRYGIASLEQLDDGLERKAVASAASRPR